MQTERASMAWYSKIGALFRRYSVPVTTAGMVAAAAIYFYPQTLGLQRYQHFVAQYKDGAIVPVDGEVQQLIEKVLFVSFGNCMIVIKKLDDI